MPLAPVLFWDVELFEQHIPPQDFLMSGAGNNFLRCLWAVWSCWDGLAGTSTVVGYAIPLFRNGVGWMSPAILFQQ